MKTICAWCQEIIRDDKGDLISHGICKKCRSKIESELNGEGVIRMFDQEKVAQMVSNLARDYTTANIQVMKTTMEQWEKTMNTLIKQGAVAQDEGTKLFADWWSRAKQGQQQYYNIMEDGLKNMENIFGTMAPEAPKRATK